MYFTYIKTTICSPTAELDLSQEYMYLTCIKTPTKTKELLPNAENHIYGINITLECGATES